MIIDVCVIATSTSIEKTIVSCPESIQAGTSLQVELKFRDTFNNLISEVPFLESEQTIVSLNNHASVGNTIQMSIATIKYMMNATTTGYTTIKFSWAYSNFTLTCSTNVTPGNLSLQDSFYQTPLRVEAGSNATAQIFVCDTFLNPLPCPDSCFLHLNTSPPTSLQFQACLFWE